MEQANDHTFRRGPIGISSHGLTAFGTRAHVARGSPLTVNIRSNNHIPLIMEAHQSLGAAIPLACCRDLQVTIENSDNAPGIIAIGVLLTDSSSLGKPTFYLGQQTVVSNRAKPLRGEVFART